MKTGVTLVGGEYLSREQLGYNECKSSGECQTEGLIQLEGLAKPCRLISSRSLQQQFPTSGGPRRGLENFRSRCFGKLAKFWQLKKLNKTINKALLRATLGAPRRTPPPPSLPAPHFTSTLIPQGNCRAQLVPGTNTTEKSCFFNKSKRLVCVFRVDSRLVESDSNGGYGCSQCWTFVLLVYRRMLYLIVATLRHLTPPPRCSTSIPSTALHQPLTQGLRVS
ncbi:hypothetical protein J6590_003641 [Homalodisca vitripennis]|nr:hypothetical protein J6590_003641 [Homalodisca vitripennis]